MRLFIDNSARVGSVLIMCFVVSVFGNRSLAQQHAANPTRTGHASGSSQTVHNAPESVRGAMNDNTFDLLSEMAWRFLSDIAIRFFSGNRAELFSGNEPELLSGNEAKLLSENEADLLSGNDPSLLSGNQVSFFSNNEIEIHISESGNTLEQSKGSAGKVSGFNSLDANHDGELTFQEFRKIAIGKRIRKLRRQFRRLDSDSSGFVTTSEFALEAPSKKPIREKRAKQW